MRGLALVLLSLVALLPGCGFETARDEADDGNSTSVTGVLSGEDVAEGFPRVTGPREFEFPADHGAHPEYRHEWWYVTGNLESDDGRRFGYQLTFFRFRLVPDEVERRSGLATDQVWMAHLAVTDPAGGRFEHAERLARGAAGLAGAQPEPFRVWLEDWELAGHDGEDVMPMTISAEEDGLSVQLRMQARKPLVLQGDRGYSRKGPDPGNASHYYSWTRLDTEGELTVDGERIAVSGESWMDREWGTSTLTEEQTGWDWLSLQLSDDREIMFYHLRREDGGVDPHSKGLLVETDGAHRVLDLDEVRLRATRYWDSDDGRARYPVAWTLEIPGEDLQLVIEAILDEQELRNGFRYWEGAVDVSGSRAGQEVTGHGYAELTGYAE